MKDSDGPISDDDASEGEIKDEDMKSDVSDLSQDDIFKLLYQHKSEMKPKLPNLKSHQTNHYSHEEPSNTYTGKPRKQKKTFNFADETMTSLRRK
jgi:hypothetical protein